MSNVYNLADHQPRDLNERQFARALGVEIKVFREAQYARILPPATRRDEGGHGYWSRQSVHAVVEFFAAMSKGRDVQHQARH